MKAREVVKEVTGFVISYGTGSLVGMAINKVLPPTITVPAKVCCIVAGCAMALAAGKKAEEAANEFIDDVCNISDQIKEHFANKETAED